MDTRWNAGWEGNTQTYDPAQIEQALEALGIQVTGGTHTDFQAYCPYHPNDSTPALTISKTTGLFKCWNPSCATVGSLDKLFRDIKGLNKYEARRYVRNTLGRPQPWEPPERLPDDTFATIGVEAAVRHSKSLWADEGAQVYLRSRSFVTETLRAFEVGYSAPEHLIMVPMHDPYGGLVGFIGRSIEGKRFKNTPNLPVAKTLFNLHRAKAHDTVIVVEASFDAMRVHQAGYPNVVAMLHGHINEHHLRWLGRYFSNIVIMTDFDRLIKYPTCVQCHFACKGHNPGRDLGMQIAEGLPHKRISWAVYGDTVYPHNAKDPGDMTDREIKVCLENAVSQYEYAEWLADGRGYGRKWT